jgi:hypothetical protein
MYRKRLLSIGFQVRDVLFKCHSTHPKLLWQQFCPHFGDDLWHRLRQHYDIYEPTEEDIYNEILCEQSNKDLSMFLPCQFCILIGPIIMVISLSINNNSGSMKNLSISLESMSYNSMLINSIVMMPFSAQ